MSGATAAYRIVGREFVTLMGDDDLVEDIATNRDRNSWKPKVNKGAYEVIRPDLSTPMETKGVRRSTSSAPPYPAYLAKVFVVGVAIFLIGCTLFVASVALKKNSLELGSWILLAIGASIAALSLVRAQDLSRRHR
jgi:hypothetical protein